MAESTPLEIGVKAFCTDGECGTLTQVVLDPIADRVTHVIVEPEHREGKGRLVPVEVAEGQAGRVNLHCTREEFDKLEIAEEIRFLPGGVNYTGDYAGFDPGAVVLWPYFGAGNASVPVAVDTLPVGEVAVRRGEEVHATDGRIGEVEGLIVEGGSHRVTHVLLKEGHLFNRKNVAIPITSVASVDDAGIRLSISKRDVEELPAVDLQRLGG